MLGYREGGNTLEENTTRSSVKSCSVASKTGASKHLPVHDLIQEELERRAVKTLSNSHTRLPIHLVSPFYTTFNQKNQINFQSFYVDENRNNAVGQEHKDLKADVSRHQKQDRWVEDFI